MKNQQPLTIDPEATKQRIKADGRTVKAYARLRGFAEGTMGRIVAGFYPFDPKPDSVYQRALRQLAEDEYLVQKADNPTQAAA